MSTATNEIAAELLKLHPGTTRHMMPQYVWAVERMNKPGMVLDVGCDGSVLDKYLERRGFQVICADIDPSAAYYVDHEPRDLTKFFLVDCRKPPTSWHGKFDYISILCTLEHMETLEYVDGVWRDCLHPDEDAVMVEALSRCLKPDGKMFITVPGGDGFDYEGIWKVRCYNEKNIARITEPSHMSLNYWKNDYVEGAKPPIFFAELTKKGEG